MSKKTAAKKEKQPVPFTFGHLVAIAIVGFIIWVIYSVSNTEVAETNPFDYSKVTDCKTLTDSAAILKANLAVKPDNKAAELDLKATEKRIGELGCK